MKKIIFVLLILFGFSASSQASLATYCAEEIVAESAALAVVKGVHRRLLKKMKEYDKVLSETIDLLNFKIVSALDENMNITKNSVSMNRSSETIGSLVNTESIVARTRLVALKAAILRLQFYMSQMEDDELKEFEEFKKSMMK